MGYSPQGRTESDTTEVTEDSVCITESLCCTCETKNIVTQLYFPRKKSDGWIRRHPMIKKVLRKSKYCQRTLTSLACRNYLVLEIIKLYRRSGCMKPKSIKMY